MVATSRYRPGTTGMVADTLMPFASFVARATVTTSPRTSGTTSFGSREPGFEGPAPDPAEAPGPVDDSGASDAVALDEGATLGRADGTERRAGVGSGPAS